jgi:hypothetical protein
MLYVMARTTPKVMAKESQESTAARRSGGNSSRKAR